jgi:hypothetical protein
MTEKSRLRMFQKKVLKKIFRPKKDEVRGEWGKLFNYELNNLYSLTNVNG